MKLKSLSDLNDALSAFLLCAPDRFRSGGTFGDNQEKNLVIAFEMLNEAFFLVERKVKSPESLNMLRSVLSDALRAYQAGDNSKGANLLQEFQGVVFPNRFKEYQARKGL